MIDGPITELWLPKFGLKLRLRRQVKFEIFNSSSKAHFELFFLILLPIIICYRRPYWWGGVVNLFGHVAAFNQSDDSIDRSNCRTAVTCQNDSSPPVRTFYRNRNKTIRHVRVIPKSTLRFTFTFENRLFKCSSLLKTSKV